MWAEGRGTIYDTIRVVIIVGQKTVTEENVVWKTVWFQYEINSITLLKNLTSFTFQPLVVQLMNNFLSFEVVTLFKAQLVIFIRGVDKEFTVTEELLDLQPLKETTTGEDIFNEVQKFKASLDEISAEYDDVIYYCEVRWLGKGKMLKRFYKLRNEIADFMQIKNKLLSGLSDPKRDAPDVGVSSNVVTRLISTVPRNVNYKILFDNWFNSIKLQIYLYKNGLLSLRTIRMNRVPNADMPTEKVLKIIGRDAMVKKIAIVDDVKLSLVSCSRKGCVRPLYLSYSDASADGVEERSLVPRSRSHSRLRRNATMSHTFSYVQPAFIDL
ncbi:hypothetical protein EVAR_2891_1 [Eumeta japonica]|uniref:PiggyBac transposable element-derived protein domain-containing protein n=1 Tax=Eumeta variegata TaxID=151549 RepID=A0A4C1T1K1_EUMVA|nr:hypothetical protein EVAR_2891_1 [Eumeta japonica]